MWKLDHEASADFFSPAAILSGPGAVVRAADALQQRAGILDGTLVLVADDIVIDSGLTAGLQQALSANGHDVVVVRGLGSEPTAEAIDEASRTARDAGAVAVIGVGGGSVLDSAKIIALLLRNDGTVRDWIGAVDQSKSVAPLILVPTTCGTGSEATRVAMVTVDGVKRVSSSPNYIPDTVIIDQELAATLPGPVTASTGMDALAHAVESIMSTSRSPMTAHHAFRAIELIIDNLESACTGDREALAACLWASHLAGQALNAGVVLGHSLSYCLSYERPMPHGTGCALALPYCLAYNSGMDPALGSALALALTRGRSADLRAAAEEVKSLAERIGLPTTLDQAGIAEGVERDIALRCVREYPRPTNPVPFEEEQLVRLVEAMRSGDLSEAFAVASVEVAR
jgi:alcohol dehydrogenase class IV